MKERGRGGRERETEKEKKEEEGGRSSRPEIFLGLTNHHYNPSLGAVRDFHFPYRGPYHQASVITVRDRGLSKIPADRRPLRIRHRRADTDQFVS